MVKCVKQAWIPEVVELSQPGHSHIAGLALREALLPVVVIPKVGKVLSRDVPVHLTTV